MHTGIPEEKRPDYFDRLQELIGCGSLELIQEDGKCRLVYLMNDAAESFLVFEEAVVTGFCDKKIMDNHAVLDLYKEGYILSVNQGGENAFTIRFRNMSFEIKLYDYGDIGHFWIEDDEDLRWLNCNKVSSGHVLFIFKNTINRFYTVIVPCLSISFILSVYMI